jgi:hypothetical protein
MAAAFLLIFSLAGAGAFIYWSLNREQSTSGYVFRKRTTGTENALILFAQRNGNGRDTPVLLKFVEIKKPPKGARLHYLRNIKRHVYELHNNPAAKTLQPVMLPDKKPFPPDKFTLAATMQPYKDALEYVPPSNMQKIGPVALVIAMGVVAILIIVTTTGTPGV